MEEKSLSMIRERISKQFSSDDSSIGDRLISIICGIYLKEWDNVKYET